MSASGNAAGSRSSLGAGLRALLWTLAESFVAILFAVVVGGIGIFLFSGFLPNHSAFDIGLPVAAYGALWSGAVTYPNGVGSTLAYSTPLILAGLGVGLGFKAGLFNIGGRGQFLMGAIGALAVVTLLGDSLPGFATIALALVIAAVFGGFAGFIPGALKATSGAHEVVTTIMLNYVFVFVAYWAISGPLRLPHSPQPITVDVGTSGAALGTISLFGVDIFGRSAHWGVLLAPVFVVLLWFLLFRTTLGFEIRAAGANSDAARYAGMKTRQLVVLTMSMAGALCGLAGGTTILGVVHQIAPGYDTTIGFDAITVALLGRSNPIGIALAGLLLGGMRAGSQSMQISPGVPGELVDALQAVILLFLVINMLRRLRLRRHAEGPTVASAEPYGLGAVSTEAAQ
jgi:general nucleoside transport system permease protein